MGYSFLMNHKKKKSNVSPVAGMVYGIKIDTTNPNPETALTYTDDAIGFTPAKMNFTTDSFEYGSWQDKFPFNQIKPCVLKDGVVNYYLNPNDYTKKIDGANADITSGNDGDVMVEFPKIWWKFETIGNDLYIRYSNMKVDDEFKCLAHTRGTAEKEVVYIASYLGHSLSTNLRSLSGKLPTSDLNLATCRIQAKARGYSYEQMAYYQLLMLQVLYAIMFKNLDSQTALGRGFTQANATLAPTGESNTKGMFYGENSGKLQMKFCGIEDFYGNAECWIDGLVVNSARQILIGNENFSNAGTGYTNYQQGASSNISGFIRAVQGGTETGFIIKSVATGGGNTYYSDYGDLNASSVPTSGGAGNEGGGAGVFYLRIYATGATGHTKRGARLTSL